MFHNILKIASASREALRNRAKDVPYPDSTMTPQVKAKSTPAAKQQPITTPSVEQTTPPTLPPYQPSPSVERQFTRIGPYNMPTTSEAVGNFISNALNYNYWKNLNKGK